VEVAGVAGGVGHFAGDAASGAEVVDAAGQGAGLDDHDRGPVAVEEFGQLVAAGGERVEVGLGGGAVVGAGDALEFAQVDGQNEAGGGRGGVRQVRAHGASSLGVRGSERP